jgi:lipopolysaccharide transport system ATP-binding protein
MSDIVIKAENLGKKYIIGHQARNGRYLALRDVLMQNARSFWRVTKDLLQAKPIILGDELEEVWALKDVDFEIQRGDVVGIIGRNGAGKSTLLKILSRITEPSSGRVTIKGRVASLLEVGTGFHPELTGRENIYLNGAILGMTRLEIKRKFDEIVDFSGVARFLDTPVKRYSSGMYVRLAFAVAAHLEPEILLVDEVLAVGDAAFQRKCLGKMGDVARAGRTVFLVSHNMSAIRQLCRSCLWFDEGMLRQVGSTTTVVESYLKDTSSGAASECYFESDPGKEFQLRAARLLDRSSKSTQLFGCDEPIIIDMICQVHHRIPGLYGYLAINKGDGTLVWVSDSYHRVRIQVPARTLAPGDYTVYVNFTSTSGVKGFQVDSPGTILAFHIDDYTSRRGNKRGGYFSTLLAWQVEEATAEQLSWSG